MRLTHLTARNFLGISHADIDLAPLTLLFGANGAGKSSLADAIFHALTGETVRGATLRALIRQGGAKSMDVELSLLAQGKPLTIARHRTLTDSATQSIDNITLQARETQDLLQKRLGVRLEAIRASLQAGALLELKPTDLQRLLADVTGARFDSEAIRAEMGAAVLAAAQRIQIPIPDSLERFPEICKAAEARRQHEKRQLAEREADLERLPEPVVQAPPDAKQRLAEARRQHEQGIATAARHAGRDEGARLERVRQLTAHIQELEQIPAVEAPGTLPSLEEAIRTGTKLEGQLQSAKIRLEDLTARADGLPPASKDPRPLEELRDLLERARAAAFDASKDAGDAERDWKSLKAGAKAAKPHKPCEPCCAEHCPSVPDPKAISARQKEIETKGKAAKARLEIATAEQAALAAAVKSAEAEQLRAQLGQEIAAEKALVLRYSSGVDEARASAERLRPQVEAAKVQAARHAAYKTAQEHLVGLRSQLAVASQAPAAAPTVDVPELAAAVQLAEQQVAAVEQHARRGAARAAIEAARTAIQDADLLAQATGPLGARLRMVAKASGPFLAAANAALAQLCQGYRVEVEAEEGFRLVVHRGDAKLTPAMLSKGERWRLLSVLQYAICKLAGVGLLVLDDPENLEDAGRKAAVAMARGFTAEGIQVLMLTCAEAKASYPASVAAYLVEAGTVRRLPASAGRVAAVGEQQAAR